MNTFLHVNYCGVIRYGDENSQTAFLNLKKINDRVKSAKWGYENAIKRANFEVVKKAVCLEYFYYMYMSNTAFMMQSRKLPLSLKIIKYGIKETKSISDFYWKEVSALDKRFNSRVRHLLKNVYRFPFMAIIYKCLFIMYRGVLKCSKKILH